MIRRFLKWLAEPLLREQAEHHELRVTAAQKEAYELGRAHGELLGRQALLGELVSMTDERRRDYPEVTEVDLARAKKGMVH